MTARTATLRGACAAAALLATTALGTSQALAWGHTGHIWVARAAMAALPATMPDFLLTASAQRFVGELGPEPDVSKSSGDKGTISTDIHDFERDSGHYIDFDDAGYVIPTSGYPEVAALKLSALLAPAQGRRDFDTLLRTNTPSGASFQQTQYSGYLPYNMTDQWQQIRKDFAYIRAFTAAIANPATTPDDANFFTGELRIRQSLTLRDIGVWAHFVGDASQPMHVSIHFNGWGNYPNPNGYTTAGIHAPFEGSFVKSFVSLLQVEKAMSPLKACADITPAISCNGIEPRVKLYLQQTLDNVIPLYELTKTLTNAGQGTNPWTTTTPTTEQKAFVVTRLAAAASEMRDEIVDAYNSAGTIAVGYPQINVSDIESGAVVFTRAKFAAD